MDPYLMRLEWSVTRPNAQAIIKDVIDTPPLDELIAELAREHPDDYANLAEHIEIERYRDPRESGK